MPAHCANAVGRRRPEEVQVAARKLEAGLARVDLRRRHGPDRRLARAVPADQDPAGRRGVSQPIRVFAEAAAGLAVGHRPAVEEGVQAGGEVLGDAPALGHRPGAARA